MPKLTALQFGNRYIAPYQHDLRLGVELLMRDYHRATDRQADRYIMKTLIDTQGWRSIDIIQEHDNQLK